LVQARTVGVLLLGTIVALSLIVPVLSPYPIDGFVGFRLEPPSVEHWFGTDHLGRDEFVRVFAAGRLDIALATIGVALPFFLGTFLGALAGSSRHRSVDTILDGLMSAVAAIPEIVLILGLMAILGVGVESLIVAIWMTRWVQYARLARGRTLVLRRAGFVEAAEILGLPRLRILVRHIMPNVYADSVAYALSDFVFIIVIIGALSFLGLGIRPPTPEWGGMISEGRLFLQVHPSLVIFPGLMLSLTAVAVSMIGRQRANAS
jgi:peptide/nickel transport system permease protein